MPMILKSFDQIMDEEKRDMYFIDFGRFLCGLEEQSMLKMRQEHFEWFGSKGLRHASAAPRGWLEGDPGLYAVYFTGLDDPRVAEYTARFENPDGLSLDPDTYQMSFVTYESWLAHDGPGHLARDLAEDNW